MAHHAEPMDIDESDFDNKENTYQQTNVLPRTPCTEKGYEELDVSELNMKLRYSITPAASPMSKSMSHCLDIRYNTSTDESLTNTIINEYENNLTRSLNSTLNKTEVRAPKVIPLQALPTDIMDSSRGTSVLRPLESTETPTDITITVSNENDIDNLSFPSSSTSMANTPEATTPTKEIPKHDGGSPIMRGLKSVLSIFRSSQSPIPPGDEEFKTAVINPADISPPEVKPLAIASTPKTENIKETSISRRNSPFKESIVFNEDLEKELQWSDDSTIVFSSEKIPMHKLFFQEKSPRPAISNANVKIEDANLTVEYMDLSYNDLSIKDTTLNGTVNKSNFELPESDGEFVDCESTFTHNKVDSTTEEVNGGDVPGKQLPGKIAVISEPCMLETTNDIINSIDSCQTVVGDLGKQLDISTTDIVNQLSDLINEEIVEENIDTKNSKFSDVQLECIQNQVTSPVDSMIVESISALPIAEQVCIDNDDLGITATMDSNAITTDLESINTKFSSVPVDVNALNVTEVRPTTKFDDVKISSSERANKTDVAYPSPVDIPLPNEDDFNEINDNESQDTAMPVPSISQHALMTAALNKSIPETPHDIKSIVGESEIKVNTCPPSLLSSDDPILNTADPITMPHESMTVVNDPVQFSTIEKPEFSSTDMRTSKINLLNETDNISKAKAAGIPDLEIDPEGLKSDISSETSLSASIMPLPALDDLVRAEQAQETLALCPDLVKKNATEKPDIIPIKVNTSNIDLNNEASIIKTEIVPDKVSTSEVIDTPPVDLIIPAKEEHMEVSFVEPTNDKFSKSLMDVSMADATNLEHSLNQIEVISNVISALPEIMTGSQVVPNAADIVTVDNSSQVEVQISDDFKIDEGSTKDIVLGSMSITVMDKDMTRSDLSNFLDVFNENANGSADLKTCGDVEPVLNIVFQRCEKATAPETPAPEKVANVAKDKDETTDVLKLNEVAEATPDIDSDFDVPVKMNMRTAMALKSEEEHNLKETVVCNENKITAVKELSKDADMSMDLHSSQIVENASIYKEKVDEEIVVSESNSPFVSMSAEEVLDLDMKQEDCEEVENVSSTKPKETPPPVASPKIVSKGYNFNFDDIDSINPFVTKAKIRMSPPLSPSANASIVTENMNKTEIVERLKSENHINRRKSMPEKKKPLKAKMHFNSTFDSTENTSSKTTVPKKDNVEITSTADTKEEVTAAECPWPEINQNESNSVAFPTQNASHDNLDVTISSKTSAHEEKANQIHPEAVAIPSIIDSGEDTNGKSVDETNTALNHDTKMAEDCVMSKGGRLDTTSSSEQSTVGASLKELVESKNVFNLPELDNFNPFATKTKIRQSPPRELDMDNPFVTKSKIKSSPETSVIMAPDDPNCAVTDDNEKESKETIGNVSTCSGSSKTSNEKDITVHEIHTEDEDTLEGPFLEADDGNDAEMTEFTDNKVDMVELADTNPQENEEAAEMFIDAEAFEFLMNQNKSDEVAYSGKESLFLKFDPLFARRVTLEGVSSALNEIKRKQSTPKKTPKQTLPKETEHLSFEIPVAGPSELNNTREVQSKIQEKSEDVNAPISKPMMAVTPAVNPVVMPKKILTPNKSNRLSMTFTSPAMAVIDRLLLLSGNSPSAGLDTTVTQVDRTQSEADQALTQLRELLAEKEIHVYNLRCETKELRDRLSTLETQMKALEAEGEERLKKVNELNENLAEKTNMNRNMAAVVEEYERTIASLISETEQDKKRFAEERNQLMRDRDEQTAHLASMEVSFNDLHSKYEKSKQVIIGYKTNEEAYKKSIQDFEENLSKMHTNYELLKQHATSKLNHANQELEKINKTHEAEVLKFNAMIKRKELDITSLEESLSQKTKANEELTAICDELINKVG